MKTLPFLLLAALCVGCSAKSEFDIAPDQAKQVRRTSGPIDPNHLPPGAVKQEKTYHKGDVLPDGSIATGDRKVVRIQIKK